MKTKLLLLWLGLLTVIGLGAADSALAAKAVPKPAGIEGTVVHVIDGDSLRFAPATGEAPIEVRLFGIDAPELCQEWGTDARQFLAEEVLKQRVRLVLAPASAGRDDYGRTLATLWKGEVNVNVQLVEEGQAWSARYRTQRGPYLKQETMARALRRGLHQAGPAALYPRDFRQRHGPCREVAAPAPAAPKAASKFAPAPNLPIFRCDGRARCNQMTSCVEATFFLRNCPGVQMDERGNGIACEQQWCQQR